MATVLGITAVNEISPPKTSTVSASLQSCSLTPQGDKGYEVPQVTSVPLESVICHVEMGDTLLPRPILHNSLWVPG